MATPLQIIMFLSIYIIENYIENIGIGIWPIPIPRLHLSIKNWISCEIFLFLSSFIFVRCHPRTHIMITRRTTGGTDETDDISLERELGNVLIYLFHTSKGTFSATKHL